MEKWHVTVSPEAARKLEKIYLSHPQLRPDILARLKALEHFPPRQWFFIYQHRGIKLFRAETHQTIRLSGEAHAATKTVQVTSAALLRRRP